MRFLCIISLFLLVGLCSSTPINWERILINRPTPDTYLHRSARDTQHTHNVYYVKGGLPNPHDERKIEHKLRKGEYRCGDKICKLNPGDLPRGCEDHICQYPIRIH